MSEEKEELPADLKKFRDSYVELFGTLPPLPAARFEFSGEVDPEVAAAVASSCAPARSTPRRFDMKTTQLILFGMLLAEHNQVGAQAHAAAARRAGASWQELHKVVELAAGHRRALSGEPGQRAAQRAARQGSRRKVAQEAVMQR